jgi:hypothetical protein
VEKTASLRVNSWRACETWEIEGAAPPFIGSRRELHYAGEVDRQRCNMSTSVAYRQDETFDIDTDVERIFAFIKDADSSPNTSTITTREPINDPPLHRQD